MIRWAIPPGPVRSTATAHAHWPPREISVCERFKGLDKGYPASSADRHCERCVRALEQELLERLGKKGRARRDGDWGIDDMLREGEMRAVAVRASQTEKCVWGFGHLVRKGDSVVLIEVDEDKGYVCLPCWDKTRISVLK